MRLLLILIGLLVFGAARAAEAGDCGTVITPADDDITSLNPILATSNTNFQAGSLMYLGLVWLDDNGVDWSRSIASAITTPDGGTTYLVTLRPWHWSDGVPVTAADVIYTFGMIKALGAAYAGTGTGGIPGMVRSLGAVDATHLKIVLARQVNATWFITNGLSQLIPLPAHDWSRYSLDQIWQAQSTPAFFAVVDGPLRVARLDVGQDAVFVPNPAYAGPKLHFHRLVLRFLDNDNTAVQGVESGDLDFAALPDDLWNAAQHLPGVYLATQPGSGWSNIVLNFRNPATAFFNDARVRQAMEDSIDQMGMIRLVFHGTGAPVHAPLPQLPPALLSPALRAGDLPVGYDPSKARALLLQAGYAPGPDGIMQKAGHKLGFVMLFGAGDSLELQETEFVQADLRKAGIDMRTHSIAFEQMLALLYGPPSGWQAALVNIDGTTYPSGATLFATGAGENFGGYSDPRMDALIAASEFKPGFDGLFGYEDYVTAQQPSIAFTAPATTVLARSRIRGVASFVDAETNQYPDHLNCTEAYP